MARKPRKKKSNRPIAVIDFETDPFLYNRKPEAFAAGFYSQELGYRQFWGDNCVYELAQFLETLPPHLIYAHNGGKFDFFFLLEKQLLTNPALIIHGRITKCGFLGLHELRDSFAIIPMALAKLGNNSKIEIEYEKMERHCREEHRQEISEYLEYDCRSLYKFVFAFIERFGPKLTIGATAISQLGKLHNVRRLNRSHDEKFRPFYYGGRVQCFEHGEINGKFKIYDVNSMYPDSMANFEHPDTRNYLDMDCKNMFARFDHKTGKIADFGNFYFACVKAKNNGCLPIRVADGPEKGRISFDKKDGIFWACSHEIQAGIELGLLEIQEFLQVLIPANTGNFKTFVDMFVKEKIDGKNAGDDVKTLFSKLILNSSYGKFATNIDSFKNWFILVLSDENCLSEFETWRKSNTFYNTRVHGKINEIQAEQLNLDLEKLNSISSPTLYSDNGGIELWDCPAVSDKGWYDVAVAASITSAARSVLLRAIHSAKRPLYCDTDSLICEEMGNGIKIHDTELGAWAWEGNTQKIYIAGKKIYACELDNENWEPIIKNGKRKIKIASKGAKLNYSQVKELTEGKIITWRNDAPNFKINGDTKFIERKIKKRY